MLQSATTDMKNQQMQANPARKSNQRDFYAGGFTAESLSRPQSNQAILSRLSRPILSPLRPSQSPLLQRACSCGGKTGGECAECKKKAETASGLHSPAPEPMDGAEPKKEDDPNKTGDVTNTLAPTATPWVVGPPVEADPTAYVNAQDGELPAPTATPWIIGAAIARANTTICDGSGGITFQANDTGNAQQTTCLQHCINVHEARHVTDARADGSDVCTGKAAGATVRPPNETVRKATEIRASQAEIDCLNAELPSSTAPCTDILRARVTQITAYRDSFR